MTYLSKLSPGQKGVIVGFTDDNPMARRLFELGIQPGRSVVHVRNAPLNDPIEVQVGANCLTLRREDASIVTVEVDN